MADERDRWLDKAAADRLLRGEPAVPGAEHHARARAERLRAALDALAEPPPALGAEFPGEAAAVAAFRAARGTLPQGRAVGADVFAAGDTVVDLSPPPGSASAARPAGPGSGSAADRAARSRPARPARFALAAALASVAVGGLAAAAGAGLLDRDTHESAGQLPAVSVTAGFSPEASGGADSPLVPPSRPVPPPGGESRGSSPDPGHTPGPGDRMATGPDGDGSTGAGGATAAEPSAGVSAGGTGREADREGKDRFLLGGTEGATGKETEARTRAVALCRDYRAGTLDDDRREKLVRLANGLLRVPRYCQSVLDGAAVGGTRGDSPVSSGRKPPMGSATLEPARPLTDGSVGSGTRR